MTTNNRTMNIVGLTAQVTSSYPDEPSQPSSNNKKSMKLLSPIKKTGNFLTHLTHSAVAGVVMLAGSVQAEDVLITPIAVTAQS
ncbi:MAG: hypothetical protein WCP35_21220, partial [Verrucomicrobiota bacterium]